MMNMSSTYDERLRGAVTPWWLVLLEGIAAVILGILLLTSPVMTTVVLVQVLGFYWFLSGVLAIVNIFMDRTMWGLKLMVGVLGILAGLVVIRHPLWSAVFIPTVLVVMLAIQALINGVIRIFQAFSGGGVGIAVLGILNVVLGILLLSAPVMGALVLVILLGIVAIIAGGVAIVQALRQHANEGSLLTGGPSMPRTI